MLRIRLLLPALLLSSCFRSPATTQQASGASTTSSSATAGASSSSIASSTGGASTSSTSSIASTSSSASASTSSSSGGSTGASCAGGATSSTGSSGVCQLTRLDPIDCRTPQQVWCGDDAPDGGVPDGCGLVTCQTAGATCGLIGDGCGGVLDCGACPSNQQCLGNICGMGNDCTPLACSDLGVTCGVIGDGCGGILSCGTCEAPLTCGGGGIANQCGGPACFCSNGSSVAIDYPAAPGDCSQVMADCFGVAPTYEPGCQRAEDDGGLLGQPGDSCTEDADCACDLACAIQFGQGACDLRCATTADCTLPYTVCTSGVCLTNFCGGASGNAAIDGRCDASDAGDGTCVAPVGGTTVAQLDGGTLGICVQGGSVPTDGFCGPNAERGQPDSLCVVGDDCLLTSSETSRCAQVCDPTAVDAGCAAPEQCRQFSFAGPQFGMCL